MTENDDIVTRLEGRLSQEQRLGVVWSVIRWVFPVALVAVFAWFSVDEISDGIDNALQYVNQQLNAAGITGDSLEDKVAKIQGMDEVVATAPVEGDGLVQRVENLVSDMTGIETELNSLGVNVAGRKGVVALGEAKLHFEETARTLEVKNAKFAQGLAAAEQQNAELAAENADLRAEIERLQTVRCGMLLKGRTVVLLFGTNKTEITGEHRELIDLAVDAARTEGAKLIRITGYADTEGSEAVNKKIAEKRAEAVLKVVNEQLAGSNITVAASRSFGELCQPISTPDETQEPQNRRVEIAIE